jgi:hypothetical protein
MTQRVKDVGGAERSQTYYEAGGSDFNELPYPRWIARRMTYADFTAAATTEAVVAFTFPKHTIIHDVAYEVETDFAGGSVSAATIALGPSGGNVDAILEEVDVFTGVTNDALNAYNTQATRGVSLWDPTSGDTHPIKGHDIGATADTEYDITLTTTTANINTLTAGAFIIYLMISNPRKAYPAESTG